MRDGRYRLHVEERMRSKGWPERGGNLELRTTAAIELRPRSKADRYADVEAVAATVKEALLRTTNSSGSSWRLHTVGLWGLLLGLPVVGSGHETPEAEVEAVVERFLEAIGRQDLDALPDMFAPGASIASAALRQGRWVTRSQSFEAWLADRRADPPGSPYQEPVTDYTVHVDDGQLAFVRADALLIRDGTVRSRNIDYFTLLRGEDGRWRFVNGSYTAKPVEEPRGEAPAAPAPSSEPADSERRATAEEELRAVEQQWVDAEVRRDALALRRVLDEKFMATLGAGAPLDREAFIRAIVSDTSTDVTHTLSDSTMVIDEDSAVVVGTDTVRGVASGTAYVHAYRYTATYVRRDGRWVALGEHLVRAPQIQ